MRKAKMSISKNQIDETIAVLCREFPKCFVMFERRRRPLKLGIHLDIIAALGERIDRRLLRQALRFYTSNIHYRASQKPGVPRIDLYGDACGAVSEADAQSAARDVAARKTRKRPRAEPEITPAPPAPPPAPKRDGLAALREAAKRRRQEVA